MMMTNGLGATVGSFCAQAVVNHFTKVAGPEGTLIDIPETTQLMSGWSMAWYVFAGFALAVGILFAILFKYKHNPQEA